MSYAELDRRSNALAWLLRRRGVSADMPVGVAIERGTGLVTALLAVLKAGGAYVPVDIGSPASRVAAMIGAAGARLVLVTAQTAAAMPRLAGVGMVRVDTELGLAADERAAPPDVSHPLSLAYVSFTSGSTGVPKGVAVPQRAVIRLISDPTFASLGPGERLLHLAPVAFDASTLEIWGALLTGATVVIAPPGPLGLPDVASLLRTAGVTVAWLTAGLFHQLAETDVAAIADVPVVLAGGDVLNPDTVRAVLAARRGQPLVNGYGPTENTTFTTCHVMTDPRQAGATVPIGRPIQHTAVHVLDPRGTARADWRDRRAACRRGRAGPRLRRERRRDGAGVRARSVRARHAPVPDRRPGALAPGRDPRIRRPPGRSGQDPRVPSRARRGRGGSPGASGSAGVGRRGRGPGRAAAPDRLRDASGTAWTQLTLRPSALRDFVAQRLPDYLVPAGFKAVDRFPLNASGKVDRAALPAPDRETRRPATPPRGATEERLAVLWRRLLPENGTSGGDVGREDSFFALGGNSLSAARLMFRVAEVFDVELPLAAFYEVPTLAACAAAIDAARPAGQAADRAPRPDTAPSGISRRDRSAYRVAASQPSPDEPRMVAADQRAADQEQEG